LLEQLRAGKDSVEDAESFLAEKTQIPDALVLATIGNRTSNISPCPKALRLLLEGRANPSATDPMTQGPVIHNACYFGTVEVVGLLLEFRADIEAKEPRMKTPPLNTALAAGNAKVCLDLLNRNADVSWKHEDGATPLHVATAWIASAHNAQLRMPPVGEEPRAVIHMMLHNGVDPTQTEGMSKGHNRGTGMTPLESFRREIARSPWRSDEQIGPKFDKTAKLIHQLLEQGEDAVKAKKRGNTAFGERKFAEALDAYADGRRILEKADIRGHHMAVLWSNEATCFKKTESWEKCRHACEQGLTHYCTASIRKKITECLKEATEELDKIAQGIVKEPPPQKPPAKPPTKLKDSFLEEAKDKPLYSEEGSVQGKVHNPGPYICGFEDAKEAGFVDGVDGWKDTMVKEEQALDRQLVKEGLMSPDLLDDPKSLDLINRLPPGSA